MGKRCLICGLTPGELATKLGISESQAESGFEKHHVSYQPERIVWLCATCHRVMTYSEEANRKFRELLEEAAVAPPEPKDLIGPATHLAWRILSKKYHKLSVPRQELNRLASEIAKRLIYGDP